MWCVVMISVMSQGVDVEFVLFLLCWGVFDFVMLFGDYCFMVKILVFVEFVGCGNVFICVEFVVELLDELWYFFFWVLVIVYVGGFVLCVLLLFEDDECGLWVQKWFECIYWLSCLVVEDVVFFESFYG